MGQVEGISAGVIFGWVSHAEGVPAEVEVAIDGVLIGAFDAPFDRKDIEGSLELPLTSGFAIDLQGFLSSVKLSRIEVFSGTGGAALTGSPISEEVCCAAGVVDLVSNGVMHGWVVLADASPNLATLELWVDGDFVLRFAATQLRTDLRNIGITRTRCGFRQQLPAQFHDGQPHAVQIKVDGTDFVLREGDFSITVDPEPSKKLDLQGHGEGPTTPAPASALALGQAFNERLDLLRASEPRFMLHILHAWGGGTQLHVSDLCERLSREDVACLILQPDGNGALQLTNPGNSLVVSLPALTPIDVLAQHLRSLNVWHIHFHHTIGLPQTIWSLPEQVGCAFDVTVHDYYFSCPRVNLLDANGVFCDQPPIGVCERCIKAAPLQELIGKAVEASGGSVADWRALHRTSLGKARRVIAPSHDAGRRTALIFPDAAINVQPHPEPSRSDQVALRGVGKELRVVLIGHIARIKGHALLLNVAKLALEQGLPLRFIIVGDTVDDDAYAALCNVDILGAYSKAELQSLITLARGHVALFLSSWPETYSYTLSEAWRAGLLPVVTGLGAQAERVSACRGGLTMSARPTAQEVVETLVRLHQSGSYEPSAFSGSCPEAQSIDLIRDYYQL